MNNWKSSPLTLILSPRGEANCTHTRHDRTVGKRNGSPLLSGGGGGGSGADSILKGGFDNAVLPKTWRDAEQASHLVSSRWRRTRRYKNEGIDYEHVVTTEGFNEAFSIMYHLRPPTRVRNVKLLKCEELKKVTDSPLRHHHLKTANIPRKGDLYTGRIPILFNQDVIAYRSRPEKAYDKFRVLPQRWRGRDHLCFPRRRHTRIHFREATLSRRGLHRDSARNYLQAGARQG